MLHHNLESFKALAGAARKAALTKMVAQTYDILEGDERQDLLEVAAFALKSESQAIKDLALKLEIRVNATPATQPEVEKKDTPVTTVDFAKLEVTVAAQVEQATKSGKSDVGRNLRDRHPSSFGMSMRDWKKGAHA